MAEPHIYVVLAIYQPDPGHLRAQVASIAGQTHKNLSLIAVIADTVSGQLTQDILKEAGLEPAIVPCTDTTDAPRAFEAGIAEALRLMGEDGQDLIALSDQDDIWHPDRLAKGVAELARTGAALVHSDARLVAGDGETVLKPSMFRFERRHPTPGLRGLLYQNNITGMPFPGQSGVHYYHDLWLGLMAAGSDGVALLRTPTVDYRQHGGNVMGAVDREGGWLARTKFKRPDAMWLRREAAAYALGRYLAQSALLRLTDAQADGRLGDTIPKLGPLRAFLRRSTGVLTHLWDAVKLGITGRLGLARIATGFAVVSAGRVVWTLREALSTGLTLATGGFDARLYSLSPGVLPKGMDDGSGDTIAARQKSSALIDPRKTPRWAPDFTAATPHVTILVPTLNPTEIFAGIVTALDIGVGLAKAGHHVRFVATDLPVSSPGASRSFVLKRLGAEAKAAEARISLHCGIARDRVPAHKDDLFLATAWWSTHVAHTQMHDHGFHQRRFFYLIQDYEPNFYAWGPEYADAMASYGFDFTPIFNTTLLRDYFRDMGFGFATPGALAFHPAIEIGRYASRPRTAPKDKRRIAVYGRPEVPRNMFPTAVEALERWLSASGITPDQVEIVSVGLRHPSVVLSTGHVVRSLGKLAWEDYPDYLAGVDIGLSLMYSPHPSHPPIEMAASGVRVVTNTFGPKDLGALSPAILSTPATAPALAEALAQAWEAGPVPAEDRAIDLGALGLAPPAMITQLADQVSAIRTAEAHRKKRIILHVGSPKCGSTFLQQALLQSADALRGAGISYPHDGSSHPGNGKAVETCDAAWLAELFPPEIDTVVLSHEDLFSVAARADEGFADLTRAMGIEVQLLVFLRPFSEFVYGDYSQFMKQNFATWLEDGTPYNGMDFEAFTKRRVGNLRAAEFLTNWQRRFPDTPIRIASHRAIRATIEDLLGTDAPINWEVPRHHTNPSLRMADCEALAAGLADPNRDKEALKAQFKAAFAAMGTDDPGRTPDRTAWLEAQFQGRREELIKAFGYDNGLDAQGS